VNSRSLIRHCAAQVFKCDILKREGREGGRKEGRKEGRKNQRRILAKLSFKNEEKLKVFLGKQKWSLPLVDQDLFLTYKKYSRSWAPVAHSCNPSYPGGRDQEDPGLRPAWTNSSQ
jgi:hypothetical protein